MSLQEKEKPVFTWLQLARHALHLAFALTLLIWGLLKFTLPWPGLPIAIAAPIVYVLVWAMFLSPRPVLRSDRFARGLSELVLIAGAAATLMHLGIFWVIVCAVSLTAVTLSFIANSSDLLR